MTPDKLVLLIVDEAGGRLRGKTLLQKRSYFLSEILHYDLGFRAHYYGPYSPEIESGLAHAQALGFIEEQTLGFGVSDQIGFEVRRYDYSLTNDGKEIVKYLREKYPDECEGIYECLKRLSNAGDSEDYVSLSIAAKTHHILFSQGAPMTVNDIRAEAKKLGWNVSTEMTEKAVSFLEKMKLAQTQKG